MPAVNLLLDSTFVAHRAARHSGRLNLLLNDTFITRKPARHSGQVNQLFDALILHKDTIHGGRGYISGQGEGIVTAKGQPARREIWLLALKSNRLIRSVWSARDGTYFFGHLDPEQEYMIIARDYERHRALFGWDYRKPATVLTLHEQLALLRSRGFVIADHDHAG